MYKRQVSTFDPDEDEYRPQRQPEPPRKLWDSGPISPREQAQRAQAQGLRVGNKVRHSKFGVGVVLKVTPVKDDTEVEVAFPGAGPKKLYLSLARLDRLP